MQSRQAVPLVPVAVRPAYCSQQTRPVKKLCPSLLQVLRGSRAPSTFLSCGTRLPCSLVDAVRCALCCSPHPYVEQRTRPGLSTPITPSHIGQSRHPILPTSNFSLLPRRHRQRHRHRNCVAAAAVPAVLSFRRATSSRAAKTATLDRHLPAQKPQTCMSLPFPTLISTVRLSAACPPPLSSQPTSVNQTRARLKKNTKESDVPTPRRSTR